MIEIKDKSRCSGCTACQAVCPVKSISMTYDEEGFLYPFIDKNLCIGCNKCERVCPVRNISYSPKSEIPNAFLVYDNDVQVRIASAAGGAFAGIAKSFIEKHNGVVFGAAYRKDFSVHHIAIDSVDHIPLLQKSKYVQSDLEDSFLAVRKYLENGRYVLFSGTTCQIYGLKSFLNTQYDKLFCIDVICYGVPSPMIFDRYLDFMRQKYGEIDRVVIRDKEIKRKRFQMGYGIYFKGGKKYFAKHSIDPMARIFYGKIASRPICYDCPYKTLWRLSDLTVGDCWYGSEFIPGYVDRYGITVTLCQSKKGMELLSANEELTLFSVPTEQIAKVNGGMIYSSCQKPENRDLFFSEVTSMNFDDLANKYFPIQKESLKSRIRRYMIDYGILPESINHIVRQKNVNRMIRDRVIPAEANALAEIRKRG